MVRFNATQSVWKNSEDEILKAAVMKYGLNQWGRVASLFAKRTAKQCKARWDEWLDPSIKKTEWSREEDEKLLHLAKLMPTQWRTIAPLVGRTAAQCLERYERLLDAVSGGQDLDAIHGEEEQVEGGEGEEEESSSSAAVLKKKRVAAAETLPAKPDAVDMDEEELEMLSEARARLANTLGKKAKRKARERQLAEQKRIALLQKRRELKAAGISRGKLDVVDNTKRRRKNSDAEQIDYTEEVPFEQLVPKGPYDVKQERMETFRRERDERARIEKLARAQDQQKEREKQKNKKKTAVSVKDLEAKLAAERRKNEEALAIARSARPALSLPAPQVTDEELEDVAKISAFLPTGSGSVAPFAPPPMPSARRKDEIISQEARMQLQRNLQGGAAVSKTEGTGFEGANPASAAAQNVRRGLASLASRRTFAGANGRVVVLRDDLGLNRDVHQVHDEEGFLEDAEQLARGQSMQLKESLSKLPAPEYEYSVQVKRPASTGEENEEDGGERRKKEEDDARVKDRKRQKLIQERNDQIQSLLPTAVKLGLPGIPPLTRASANAQIAGERDEARRLILEEMQRGLISGDTSSVPAKTCKEIEEVSTITLDLTSSDLTALFSKTDEAPVWSFIPPAELFTLCKSEAAKVAKESEDIKRLAQQAVETEKEKGESLAQQAMSMFKQYRKALNERDLYVWMRQMEDRAGEARLEQLKAEVEALAANEKAMQQKWAENM